MDVEPIRKFGKVGAWIVALWVLFVLLLVSIAAASEGAVFKAEDGHIRLTGRPCQQASSWLRSAMFEAEVVWKGRGYRACWTASRSTVIVIDEVGDIMMVPASFFVRERII